MGKIARMQLLRPLLVKLFLLIGALFFVAVFFFAYQNTVTFFNSPLQLISIIGLVVVILLLVCRLILWSRLTSGRFLLLLSIIAVGLRVVWIYNIDTPPDLDFLDIHNAATSAAAGDFSFNQTEYFSRWVYQLGFTMYEVLVIKLFGGPILILKLFNILFNVGTAIIVYLTACKLFNEFCGRIASLFYAVYIPNIIMCSVLTNQIISTFLFSLGCYMVVCAGNRSEKWFTKINWLFIGLAFGLGNLMRPLGAFFLIGCLIYIGFIQHMFSRKNVISVLKKMTGILIVYVLLQQAASYALISAGVTPFPLSNREPYWKFLIGLNAESTGGWSQADTDYALQYKIGEERNKAELEMIKKRVENKQQLMDLFIKKFKTMWGAKDSSVMWSFEWTERWDWVRLLTQCERIFYLIMSAFACIAMIYSLKKNDYSGSTLFMLMLIIGYAALHIVIEIQTRYRLDILPNLIILQSFGMYIFQSKVRDFYSKGK